MNNQEKELNENKHFVIRFAFEINVAILLATLALLCLIKTNNVSILTEIINYYVK